MSRVFVAQETALGRQVVVKVLPTEMAAAVSIDRFKREIALAARLQHPHIVPLLAAGETGGVPYFTMPLVEGESLRVRLLRHGELPIAEGMRILREVASALAYAHSRGVVHRDIKPDNILLSGGSAMVTDFGVAKALSASSNAEQSGLTSLGVALGTPAYMAPEQASADPAIDHRADIYAFGILAFEVLTGQPPFAGRTPQGLLAAHVTEAPDNITKRRTNLPPPLGALIMRCLEKRPADRPQSAQDVVHALDDITTPSGGMEPTQAHAPLLRAQQGVGGLHTRNAAIAIVVVVVIGVATLLATMRGGAGPQPAVAAPRSVAILPVVNAGGDTSMQFFAAGMTDELTAAVARIPGLRVASRSATEASKSSDPRAAGKALGVGAVLESRMRRDANQMALTVQLTNVADGLSLWSGSYHAQVKDAFAVQDSVARAVAGALKIALSPAQQAGVVRAATHSAKAHDLYLRGRFEQDLYTEVSLKRSITLFEQAIAEDSMYAAPYAGIADSWGLLADDFMKPADVIPKAEAALERGLNLDPESPELHNSRGILGFWYDRDIPAARREMERAVAAKFDVLDGAYYLGFALLATGLPDSARAVARNLLTHDTMSVQLVSSAFSLFVVSHDSAGVREACRRLQAIEGQPAPGCRSWELENAGQLDSAIAIAQDRLRRSQQAGVPTAGISTGLVRLLVKGGRMAEARQVANEMDAAYKKHYVREDRISEAFGWVGDVPKALEYLQRGVASNTAGMAVLYGGWAPIPARKDPRILAFLKKNAVDVPRPGW